MKTLPAISGVWRAASVLGLLCTDTSAEDQPAPPGPTAAGLPAAKPPAFIEKIVSIRIPVLNLEETPLEEALDFLRARIAELDPDKDPSKRGISMLTKRGDANGSGSPKIDTAPATAPKRITYSAKNKRVDEIFKDFARLYEIDFHITDCGIVVTPAGGVAFPNLKASQGETYYTYKATDPAPANDKR